MGTINKVDYAVAYRQLTLYGNGRSLKEFCTDKDCFRQGYKDCGKLLKKALNYARSEWQAMKTVLKNGVVELSNSLAEQMMRHIKMNLKNCLNIGSEKSAVDMAFMYFLVEICRANNISPVRYTQFLVDKLSDKTVDRTTF